MAMDAVQAYRALEAKYPAMRPMQGAGKLRALAKSLTNDEQLEQALALVTDQDMRALIRQRIVPMLNFTPQL